MRGEILVEVRVPAIPDGHRGAYGKLRERGSIDFPLFGVAARLDLDETGMVGSAALCAVALQARPLRLAKAARAMVGARPGTDGFRAALQRAGELAEKQCRPLENVPGDPEYRRAMVPVYVRRTLQAAADGAGRSITSRACRGPAGAGGRDCGSKRGFPILATEPGNRPDWLRAPGPRGGC